MKSLKNFLKNVVPNIFEAYKDTMRIKKDSGSAFSFPDTRGHSDGGRLPAQSGCAGRLSSSRDTVSVDGISFIGSYVSETFDYPDGFYIDFIDITHDCRFDEYCVIGALRAYLLVRWDDPYNQGGTRVPPLNKRGIVLRDYETGITSPLGETGEATLYDLQGRMLPSKPAQGIYIKNRQKVMVK